MGKDLTLSPSSETTIEEKDWKKSDPIPVLTFGPFEGELSFSPLGEAVSAENTGS